MLLKTKNNVHSTADPLNNKTLLFKTKTDVISKADQQKQDQAEISAIKEELRGSLLSIASKLLASEHTRLHHLSEAEQQLWNSFKKADIYDFLIGDKDCIPEFQFNQNPALVQAAQPQTQMVIVPDRVLRDIVPVNYQELHTGVKKKC